VTFRMSDATCGVWSVVVPAPDGTLKDV